MRKILLKSTYPPVLLNGISMLISSIMALFTSLYLENWSPIPIMDYKQCFFYMVIIAILSNFIGYNLYAFLLKKYTATFLSFCGFIQPFFAALMGWMLLGERVTYHFYFSAAIVLIGLYIYFSSPSLSCL